jgi:hypothetical protein
MARFVRLLVGVGLVIGAVLLALYGLFAILYRGDSGSGGTYVEFGGHEINARVVGAVALAIAFVAPLCAALLLKRGRDSAT